jgi:hypothetical protein
MQVKKQTIDSFYIFLIGILILLSAMVIFTFRGIFTAFVTATDVLNTQDSSNLKIDEVKFEEAKEFVFGEEVVVPLSIKDNSQPILSVTPTPKI